MANTNITPAVGAIALSGSPVFAPRMFTVTAQVAALASAPLLIGNDLGNTVQGVTPAAAQPWCPWFGRLVVGGEREPYMATGAIINQATGFLVPAFLSGTPGYGGKDTVIASPANAEKVIDRIIRKWLWPVAAGTRTIQIDCQQARDPGSGLRPVLRVKANPDCQVWADQTAVMDGTAGSFKVLGPITVVVGVAGTLEVWREVWDPRPDVQVWWKNIGFS